MKTRVLDTILKQKTHAYTYFFSDTKNDQLFGVLLV